MQNSLIEPNAEENTAFGFLFAENPAEPEKAVILDSQKDFSHQQDRAVLVHTFLGGVKDEENLAECRVLAESAGVELLTTLTTSRATPHIKYFVGQGKAQEIADSVQALGANVVLVNHNLSPAQTRNLQNLCGCRVVDRTALILDIFALRARSHEGKLQVELAQLRHLASRLIRRLGNQDQQKGGAVGLRGPGETQLETDRRLIRVRISQLQNRLAKVAKQREQNRKTRQKADIPTISLVGYTNAGKSTLFNRLTDSGVYVADQLFATLDPTIRRIHLQDVGAAVVADTVGFIRFLPHDLVSAFKSTLQETAEATLLLHVIDCSDTRQNENIAAVEQVLEEIEAQDVPVLKVYNKLDKLSDFVPHIVRDDEGKAQAVYLSAQRGEGIALLIEAIRERLSAELIHADLVLPPECGALYALLYAEQCIRREKISAQGDRLLQIVVDSVQWQKWLKRYPELEEYRHYAEWYAEEFKQ